MIELIFYSLLAGLFALIGGLGLLWKEKWARRALTPLLSFAAGAFLAAGFLDILPEAIESSPEVHTVLIATLFGFSAFFILERVLMISIRRHAKETEIHSDHTESLPLLLILGDSAHNFLDGIVIALAYIANPALGLVTALAIFAHEVPQEIGDFGILLHQGWKKTHIIIVNVLQSLLTVPGVLVGFFAGQILEPYLPYLLGATAGIFIYISASDLIPEVHHKSGHKHFLKAVIPFLVSIILLYFLIGLTHSE